jgi:hypothetical protein
MGRRGPTDLRAAAIVGAALSCVIAARSTWVDSDHARPFGDLLDEAMGALRPA